MGVLQKFVSSPQMTPELTQPWYEGFKGCLQFNYRFVPFLNWNCIYVRADTFTKTDCKCSR